MKFQPKRFVVEVKRGTSRAAFSSPDAGPDKFSSAEAMLFGTPRKDEAVSIPRKSRAAGEAPRRILESLVEPPAPEPVIEEAVERPRRGRKPGSKNKPKVAAVLDAPRPLSAAALAFMNLPDRAAEPDQPAPAAEDGDAPQAVASPATPSDLPVRRTRPAACGSGSGPASSSATCSASIRSPARRLARARRQARTAR